MVGHVLNRLNSAVSDRYSIERELGSGGMATVYLAHDSKLNRAVAFKVLSPELAASIGSDRFLREIEIAAKLTHPNILGLYDCGEADGLLYYTMPFVEGESLRDRMNREKRLPLQEALRITEEVADALGHAHSLGVVHRDIKPENILFQGGHAVVADFGIARAVTAASGGTLTETGLAVGTPTYMSPEQVVGEKAIDGRSDIYSLGCVLYEMLSGTPPFSGENAQQIAVRRLTDLVPSLRSQGAKVPATVQLALERALARHVDQRFATAVDFAKALTGERRIPLGFRIRRRRRALALCAVIVLAAAAGWWGVTRSERGSIRRLAVLPLANFTNDSSQEYLVEGVHDELISELQQAGITVIGRTSVLQYRDTEKPVRQIAQELSVDAVIEGSVRRPGDSVEIAVRLVDARTETSRWQQTYRSDMAGVLGLYHEVTGAIARELEANLSPEAAARLASARTVDPQAYDDYLRGMFHFARLMPGDFDAALGYFERALERDSTYALAYAGIAWVWIGRAQGFAEGGFESIRQAQAHAGAAVRKALALDSTLAEVQFAAGAFRAFHEWDWTGGDAAFRKAIQINPNDATTRAGYSHLLYVTGRPMEGRAQIDRALALDSADGFCRAFSGMAYFFERRYNEAVAELNRALELGNGGGMNVVDVLYLKGARAEALAALREFYAGDQEMLNAVNQGFVEGGYRGAMHRAADVWASRPPTFMGSTYMAAAWYALAEDGERALEWLERAYEVHDPNIPYARVDPGFDLVREDARFKDLLRRAGLPQ
jgi:serine/threonine protein kinase/tetratricopeptide (TPR) repeat protein